jgi:hypothetical protein
MAGLLALSVLGHGAGHKGRRRGQRSTVAPASRSAWAMSIFDRPPTVVWLTIKRRTNVHWSIAAIRSTKRDAVATAAVAVAAEISASVPVPWSASDFNS